MFLVTDSFVHSAHVKSTLNLERCWRHLEVMGTKPSVGIALTGKVVGQCSCGELRRRPIGFGSTASIARQACCSITGGTLTAIEYLR